MPRAPNSLVFAIAEPIVVTNLDDHRSEAYEVGTFLAAAPVYATSPRDQRIPLTGKFSTGGWREAFLSAAASGSHLHLAIRSPSELLMGRYTVSLFTPVAGSSDTFHITLRGV